MQSTADTIKFLDEPTMDRYSPVLGEVHLYAPDAPPSQWGQLPWLLVTENGFEGRDSSGLRHVILPEHIQHCYHHPALIEAVHLWHDLPPL